MPLCRIEDEDAPIRVLIAAAIGFELLLYCEPERDQRVERHVEQARRSAVVLHMGERFERAEAVEAPSLSRCMEDSQLEGDDVTLVRRSPAACDEPAV